MCFFSLRRPLWAALLLFNIGLVDAQTAPANAAGATAALTYQSAFEAYRKFDDQPIAPWRGTNDTVRDVGGWRTYAKEAAPPANSAAPAASPAAAESTGSRAAAPNTKRDPAPAVPAVPGPHHGHGGKQ